MKKVFKKKKKKKKSGELFPIGWILYEEATYLHM